jgi:nucleoside-diphosphate-sugar epimerase
VGGGGPKVLITGGSGFIGTNLVLHFVSLGFAVLNLDVNIPRNKEYERFWKKVDVTNYDDFERIVIDFNPDYIIHLAARTDLNGKVIGDYKVNTKGTENILKTAWKLDGLKKIIITSSMLVCELGYKPSDMSDYCPSTLYGESKVIAENMVWQNKPGCDWAIIRPTSIWGEWFAEPYRNFFDMIIARRYYHIGRKSYSKTYGYIGNAVYQIEKILFFDTYDESNKVFYIGDYEPTNIEEWANEIAGILNYEIIHMPYILIYAAALFGDLMKKINVRFPMTTFRLHNMTTDNLVDLSNTKKIASESPYTRMQGIQRTLEWMYKNT